MRVFVPLAISVSVAAGFLTSAGPAQAVVNVSNAIVALNSTGLPGYDSTKQRFGDSGSFVMAHSSVPGGVRLIYHTTNPDETWGIEFSPPEGQSFHRGHYPVVNRYASAEQASGGIWTRNIQHGFMGDIDVLDWVPGPDGLPSRFDIVFRDGTSVASGQGYFGEIRLNQPGEGVVHLGARHLEWPSTAVGSTRINATEWLHNTSSSAVSIGPPQLAGVNATDWRVTSNACTGTLAAGATCSIVLGYSPDRGWSEGGVVAVAGRRADADGLPFRRGSLGNQRSHVLR